MQLADSAELLFFLLHGFLVLAQPLSSAAFLPTPPLFLQTALSFTGLTAQFRFTQYIIGVSGLAQRCSPR